MAETLKPFYAPVNALFRNSSTFMNSNLKYWNIYCLSQLFISYLNKAFWMSWGRGISSSWLLFQKWKMLFLGVEELLVSFFMGVFFTIEILKAHLIAFVLELFEYKGVWRKV